MFKALFQVLSQKNLMIQALEKSDGALVKAERVTRAAFAALLDGQEPGFDLYELDREINRAEVEVRRMVLEHLVVHPATDLTPGLILISTIIDIERIGDYAKNVYDQVNRAGGSWGDSEHHRRVRATVEETMTMFGEVSAAMRSGDARAAEGVMNEHHGIGRRCETIIDEILADDSIPTRDAVIMALTVRFLKRISAHLSNLASSVVNPFDRIGFKPRTESPEDTES